MEGGAVSSMDGLYTAKSQGWRFDESELFVRKALIQTAETHRTQSFFNYAKHKRCKRFSLWPLCLCGEKFIVPES